MKVMNVELSNFRGLWKNLVNDTMYPITREDYTKMNADDQEKHCDELHTALEQRYGFKILYNGGDIPSRMYAQFLEFSDESKLEYFINNIIPKFTTQ